MAHNLVLTLATEFGVLVLIAPLAAGLLIWKNIRNRFFVPFLLAPIAWSVFDDPLFFWPCLFLTGVLVARATQTRDPA